MQGRKMNLAPIGMSVYTRVEHFKQSIKALQKNRLASESELFIYSDAASKEEDETLVQGVRAFAHSISGFKKVHVIERECNYGGTKNSWLAWKEMAEKRDDGLSIYLEDDIVTAAGFLSFMNTALEFYQHNESVVSITGYCPPIKIPEDYKSDAFVLPRVVGWGMGSFPRTYELASQSINKDDFEGLKDKKVLTVGGEDILYMVKREVEGELDAGDVRCMYYQALNNKYTVYPRESLVQNIGHDGTGVHGAGDGKFYHDELWDKVDGFEFVDDIKPDERIMRANRKFRRLGIKIKLMELKVVERLYGWVKGGNN